jgi:hypothetical protein
VKFNSYIIIAHYYNSLFNVNKCIHSLFPPWFSTHLTLPFIKTLESWLFHIIRICTSKYIVKNFRNNITIHFIIFWYYKIFTQWYEHKINCRSLCFSILLKIWIKIIEKFHVLLKWNQMLNDVSSHHQVHKQEFKIQTNNAPWVVPVLNAMFI